MKKVFLALLGAATLWGYGDGTLYWTPHACDEGKAAAAQHGGHGRGESAMFALMNLEGNASAKLVLPDLSVQELPMNLNTVMLPKPRMGGYYAMVAEANTSEGVFSAVRYLSIMGRPSKVSPTKLTALPKSDLEIVPDPLHREHDRYTGSKEYSFVVSFKGTPLADTPVTLETHKTAAVTYTTDAAGSLKITLPNDFENVTPERGGNKPSEFLITVRHREGSLGYVSTFSMPYSPNPNDFWQSQEWGAGAVLIGFLGGMFLYRRSKGAKHG